MIGILAQSLFTATRITPPQPQADNDRSRTAAAPSKPHAANAKSAGFPRNARTDRKAGAAPAGPARLPGGITCHP